MNTEEQVISILLNKPNDKFLVSINPDWFTKVHLKWVFEAITDLQKDTADCLEIYGLVKTKYPDATIQLKEIESLQKSYITDAMLDHLVMQMRKQHLTDKLTRQMRTYIDAPIDENREEITQTMSLLDNLKVIDDDGSLDSTLDELTESMKHEKPNGIQTFPELDNILNGGLYGGMLMTIGARPGVGKTAFSINLAFKIVKNDPEVQVDYFTLEMNKREVAKRFISRETAINSKGLRDMHQLNDQQKKFVLASIENYRQRKVHVYDKTTELSDIIATIRRNAARCRPYKYVAMVDYIGLINVPRQDARYLQIGEITRQLKITANEYNVPILELSQLNRAVESRDNKRPNLSDLRDSGSIEQDSNVVGFLYRPNEDVRNVERLSIQKNREGEVADIFLNFQPEKMLFTEVPREVIG